jgi:MarR family transcriptional regulator, lower aerobic nicotinate degradation pathway regulator
MPESEAPRSIPAADLGMVDAVVQLSFAVQGVLGRLAAAHELSITQLRLLAILRDRDPGMLELARHLGLGKSSVSGLIDRAERRGLVARTAAPVDGRGVLVTLTADGRRLAGQIESEVVDELAGLLAPVRAGERERLSRLAARVVEHHAARRGVDLSASRR